MKHILPAICIGSAFVATAAFAHHSFSMFDHTKVKVYEGAVQAYIWANPHSRIVIVVPATAADQSTVGTWDIEANSPFIMSRQGWNKNTLKPGDKVTIYAHPLTDGGKGASLIYADVGGRKLYTDVARELK